MERHTGSGREGSAGPTLVKNAAHPHWVASGQPLESPLTLHPSRMW